MTIAITVMASTASARSFTIKLKDGSTKTFNNSDVERIEFSPDDPDDGSTISLGDPANTYIVSREGNYSFNPVLPSGKEIEGLAKVDWIWAQKLNATDTGQQLVENVRLDGDKVKFTAKGNYGNVALAGFNGEGKIVWVWLLWMTPQPEEKEFAGGATFLDRLIGATSAADADGYHTWGAVVYQWGRPVPIFSGFADEYDDKGETFNEARKWTIMNPAYGLEWKVVKKSTTMEESIAAPTTIFTGAYGKWNWLGKRTPGLWDVAKTDYDPSPAGYKIPSWSDWGTTFFSHIAVNKEGTGSVYTYNGSDCYFPHGVLNRSYDTGENIVGGNGYMSWNCEYYVDDFRGLLDDPDNKYTVEELIEKDLVLYTPTRLVLQLKDTGFEKTLTTSASPSFSLPIRCVKIQ